MCFFCAHSCGAPCVWLCCGLLLAVVCSGARRPCLGCFAPLAVVFGGLGIGGRCAWLRCSLPLAVMLGTFGCAVAAALGAPSPGEGCPLPWYSEPLALVFLAFGDCCALCFFCMLCLMHLVLTGGALAMLLGASGCDVWFPCLWRLVFLVVVLSVLCCGGRSPWLWRSVASPVGLGGLGPCLRRWVFFGCGPQCFWARCLAF